MYTRPPTTVGLASSCAPGANCPGARRLPAVRVVPAASPKEAGECPPLRAYGGQSEPVVAPPAGRGWVSATAHRTAATETRRHMDAPHHQEAGRAVVSEGTELRS